MFYIFLLLSYSKDGDPYLMYNKCDGHGDCKFGRVAPYNNDNTDEENCNE